MALKTGYLTPQKALKLKKFEKNSSEQKSEQKSILTYFNLFVKSIKSIA
jgi:hypothetical protein